MSMSYAEFRDAKSAARSYGSGNIIWECASGTLSEAHVMGVWATMLFGKRAKRESNHAKICRRADKRMGFNSMAQGSWSREPFVIGTSPRGGCSKTTWSGMRKLAQIDARMLSTRPTWT
jgi:hypothetical protein